MSLNLQDVYDSSIVSTYNAIRKQYPEEWINFVKEECGGVEKMKDQTLVDVATGTGQAILSVGNLFKNTFAIDKNINMISTTAYSFGKVSNLQAIAGKGEEVGELLLSQFPSSVPVDVIIGAQCIHWFDLDQFWKSIFPILKSEGHFICSFYGPEMNFVDCTNASVEEKQHLKVATQFSKGLWQAVGSALPHSELFYDHFLYYPFPFEQVNRKVVSWKRWLKWKEIAEFIRTGAALRCYNDLHKENPFDIEAFILKLSKYFEFFGDRLIEVDWKMTIISCSKMINPEEFIKKHLALDPVKGNLRMTSNYNESSKPQATVISRTKEILFPFIKALFNELITSEKKISSLGEFFTINAADYGCSGGKNSFHFLLTIWNYLLSLSPDKNSPPFILQSHLIDLPSNDFNALIQTYLKSEFFTDSVLKTHHFPRLIPGSFYDETLVKSSLHLGFSFSSLHWLSTPFPGPIYEPYIDQQGNRNLMFQNEHDLYFPNALTANGFNDPLVKLFHDHSQQDLYRFFLARYHELRPRGLLITSCLGYNSIDGSDSGAFQLCALMGNVLLEIKSKFSATPQESLDNRPILNVLPIVPKSTQDIHQLFTDSPILQEGFEILHCEYHQFSDPIYEKLCSNQLTLSEYSHEYLQFIRGWSEATIQSLLFNYPNVAVNEYYQLLQQRIEQSPNDFFFQNNHLILCLQRR